MVDINWGAIIWQPPFLTSGQIELSIWNSIQKNMITILIHTFQLSASYQNMGLSNCVNKNTILTFVLLVGTFGVMVK